jgi:hypothetical protein
VYNPFFMLVDSVCFYFISKEYQSVFFFSWDVFAFVSVILALENEVGSVCSLFSFPHPSQCCQWNPGSCSY